MMEVGKLYTCELNLMLYPDKETAAYLTASGMSNTEYAARRSGRDYNYVERGVPILVLSRGRDKQYCEVLAGDRKGWIRYDSWLEPEIKEIT